MKRAVPFEMRIIANDPYVSSFTAADLHVELVDLKTLYQQSDYISLHMALTPETQKMINKPRSRQHENRRSHHQLRARGADRHGSSRGGHGIGQGRRAPGSMCSTKSRRAEDPILQQESLIATPHIGGSTEEAQEIVGVRIVEQIVEYLQHGVAINAVNMPTLSPDQYRDVAPYVTLAERLGNFAAHVSTGNPKAVRLIYKGRIAEQNTNLMRNARCGRSAEPLIVTQGEPRELAAACSRPRLDN